MGRRSKCCKFSWFINDGVGIGCAIFTYLLIGYAEFVVVFVMLLPEVVRAAAFGLFHATAFTFFACLALVAHSRAMCSDPVSTFPFDRNLLKGNHKIILLAGALKSADHLTVCPMPSTNCELIVLT